MPGGSMHRFAPPDLQPRWLCRRRRTRRFRASRARVRSAPRLGDVEREPRMSAAERLLDLLRRVAAREDEPEVLPALGQRNELVAQMGGDSDLLDAGNILRRVLAA